MLATWPAKRRPRLGRRKRKKCWPGRRKRVNPGTYKNVQESSARKKPFPYPGRRLSLSGTSVLYIKGNEEKLDTVTDSYTRSHASRVASEVDWTLAQEEQHKYSSPGNAH